MASPQLENGYTKIANEILEAMSRVNFSAYQSRVIHALFRKIYGYIDKSTGQAKKADIISVSQLTKMTELHHGHVSRALKELEIGKIITRTRSGTSRLGTTISFQKDWEKWNLVPNQVYRKVRTHSGSTRTPLGTKLVPNRVDTKEKKDNNKIKHSKKSDPYLLSKLLLDQILEHHPKFKIPKLQSWASHVEKMIRLDKRDPEEISRIIVWCQKDSFWKGNILSTVKLRGKYDQLIIKEGKHGRKKSDSINGGSLFLNLPDEIADER